MPKGVKPTPHKCLALLLGSQTVTGYKMLGQG